MIKKASLFMLIATSIVFLTGCKKGDSCCCSHKKHSDHDSHTQDFSKKNDSIQINEENIVYLEENFDDK